MTQWPKMDTFLAEVRRLAVEPLDKGALAEMLNTGWFDPVDPTLLVRVMTEPSDGLSHAEYRSHLKLLESMSYAEGIAAWDLRNDHLIVQCCEVGALLTELRQYGDAVMYFQAVQFRLAAEARLQEALK